MNILLSIVGFLVTLFIFWFGGMEFERGPGNAYLLFIAIYIGIVLYTMPTN